MEYSSSLFVPAPRHWRRLLQRPMPVKLKWTAVFTAVSSCQLLSKLQCLHSVNSPHPWYTSDLLIDLTFYCLNVQPQTKAANAVADELQRKRRIRRQNQPPDTNSDYANKGLSSFVESNMKHFFVIFGFDDSLLDLPPESWNDNEHSGLQRW